MQTLEIQSQTNKHVEKLNRWRKCTNVSEILRHL